MNEKMKSGIIGFSVGDALGVPVEFLNRKTLQRNPVKEMIGYGSHPVPEGTWSDDTSLMIAAMDSINICNGINYDDIMYRFTEWVDKAKYTATDKLFDIGISSSNAIQNYKQGIAAENCGMKGFNENGNGSLMRILPFVYYAYLKKLSREERIYLINTASSLTHAHEISKLGCNIYCDYIILLLNGYSKKEAFDMLKELDYSSYFSNSAISVYSNILSGKLENLNINDIKSSGYVVDSLEASIWCTLKNTSYETAVESAVNLGNDTDTIGAITGSLNGIIYGEKNIPQRWLEKMKKLDYLENLTDEFLQKLNCKSNKRIR